MPIYVYFCEDCNKEVELYHPVSEHGTPKRCPWCERDMVQQITPPNVCPQLLERNWDIQTTLKDGQGNQREVK